MRSPFHEAGDDPAEGEQGGVDAARLPRPTLHQGCQLKLQQMKNYNIIQNRH